MSSSSIHLRLTVYSSLMAALIAAGSFIAIPLGPVPITLQTLFILLAGLLLGMSWGTGCVAVYLLAGSIGLPVFAAGKGGFTVFMGPTGGYLIGFLVAAFLVGLITDLAPENVQDKMNRRMAFDLIAVILGTLAIYAFGLAWLKIVTNFSWEKTFVVGALPFLPGAAVKMTAAVIIARAVRPLITKSLVLAAP